MMSESERVKFLHWHKKQEGRFNLEKELLDYCKSDVDILAKACLSFRKLFMEITKKDMSDSGVDPFAQCITLPSVCHYVYRRNFMNSKSIGLIPPLGYSNESTSYKSIIWLKFIATSEKIFIQHSRNGKEKKFLEYRVDGWCENTSTVYEFNGCIFHGCPRCFSSETYNPLKNELMTETYNKHVTRIEKIRQISEVKNIVQIWECEYEQKIRSDHDFRVFVKQAETCIKKPLDPRDALAGGRTNAFILHHVGSIGYVDFTSLYPYIQKYGIFPIGHPTIITENFDKLENYFGVIHCKILPPTDLLFIFN